MADKEAKAKELELELEVSKRYHSYSIDNYTGLETLRPAAPTGKKRRVS